MSFSTTFPVDRSPHEVVAAADDVRRISGRHNANPSLRNRIVTGRDPR